MYDLIIIGAGPAGITASVYAARQKINFLLISKDIGGQTVLSADVENYTGYQFISGLELAAKFEEHMKKYDFQLKEDEQVKDDSIQIHNHQTDEISLGDNPKRESSKWQRSALSESPGRQWRTNGLCTLLR